MAQEDKRGEVQVESLEGDATQLKKRARRRLIGAAALAMLAAIVLPMVMDHQPAPPLRDIQVRIPSPDEGVTQRVTPKQAAAPAKLKEEKPAPPPVVEPAKEESKAAAATETKVAAKPESPAVAELWEVQLGAYQEPGRVKLLLGKLKELGIPTYTEKVDTPNGARTRVRAGPFSSQEAAEKARVRVKIVGVDGPVAKKQ